MIVKVCGGLGPVWISRGDKQGEMCDSLVGAGNHLGTIGECGHGGNAVPPSKTEGYRTTIIPFSSVTWISRSALFHPGPMGATDKPL